MKTELQLASRGGAYPARSHSTNRIKLNILRTRRPRKINEEGGEDEEEDEEEEEEEEEESEEEGSDEAEGEGAGSELTRTERRDLKKKQAAQKAKDEEEEDPDLINPNHVTKKMNISDLNSPRELTRRERYIFFSCWMISALKCYLFFKGNRKKRQMQRRNIGRLGHAASFSSPCADLSALFASFMCRERRRRPRLICLDWPRSVRSVRLRRQRGKPKRMVSLCRTPY